MHGQFNTRRFTQASGQFNFNAAETSSTGTAAGAGGYAVASALFGLVDSGTLNYGHVNGPRYKDFDFFGQDTYKATPKLTLTYGLRYEVDLPARESHDNFSEVDPTLPNRGAGGILGAYTIMEAVRAGTANYAFRILTTKLSDRDWVLPSASMTRPSLGADMAYITNPSKKARTPIRTVWDFSTLRT